MIDVSVLRLLLRSVTGCSIDGQREALAYLIEEIASSGDKSVGDDCGRADAVEPSLFSRVDTLRLTVEEPLEVGG